MRVASLGFFREMAVDVFHHHDRAIDHHADADGEAAERHEVRAQPIPFHHDEGEERGQRQDERDDDRAAHVGEQHDEDDEHEDRAFFQRLGDGVDRLLHEIGAVVERHQFDAFRQRLLNRGQLLLHRIDDIATARAFEHQHDARDRFAFAVGRHRALPQLRADLHIRHVAHVDGRVLVRGHDDVLDVARVSSPAPARARRIARILCSMKLPLAFALFFSSASKICCERDA